MLRIRLALLRIMWKADPYRLRIYDREGSPVFEKPFNYQYTGFDIDGDLVLCIMTVPARFTT